MRRVVMEEQSYRARRRVEPRLDYEGATLERVGRPKLEQGRLRTREELFRILR